MILVVMQDFIWLVLACIFVDQLMLVILRYFTKKYYPVYGDRKKKVIEHSNGWLYAKTYFWPVLLYMLPWLISSIFFTYCYIFSITSFVMLDQTSAASGVVSLMHVFNIMFQLTTTMRPIIFQPLIVLFIKVIPTFVLFYMIIKRRSIFFKDRSRYGDMQRTVIIDALLVSHALTIIGTISLLFLMCHIAGTLPLLFISYNYTMCIIMACFSLWIVVWVLTTTDL